MRGDEKLKFSNVGIEYVKRYDEIEEGRRIFLEDVRKLQKHFIEIMKENVTIHSGEPYTEENYLGWREWGVKGSYFEARKKLEKKSASAWQSTMGFFIGSWQDDGWPLGFHTFLGFRGDFISGRKSAKKLTSLNIETTKYDN